MTSKLKESLETIGILQESAFHLIRNGGGTPTFVGGRGQNWRLTAQTTIKGCRSFGWATKRESAKQLHSVLVGARTRIWLTGTKRVAHLKDRWNREYADRRGDIVGLEMSLAQIGHCKRVSTLEGGGQLPDMGKKGNSDGIIREGGRRHREERLSGGLMLGSRKKRSDRKGSSGIEKTTGRGPQLKEGSRSSRTWAKIAIARVGNGGRGTPDGEMPGCRPLCSGEGKVDWAPVGARNSSRREKHQKEEGGKRERATR